MDLTQYVDLFLAEAQEHLRVLNRGLLDLEAGEEGSEALDEVFRAAHTIKGAAATLGYGRVADIAHELENRLDDLRAGERAVDAELVDVLLERVDLLERAVEDAVAGPPPGSAGSAPAGPETGAQQDADAARPPIAEGGDGAPEQDPGDAGAAAHPPDDALVVRVRLDADAPLRAARALLVLRHAREVADVVASIPSEAELDDDFGGTLRLRVALPVDRETLAEAIRSAGEVEGIAFDALAGREAADGAATGRDGTRLRHVRVPRRHLDELADGIGELNMLWRRFRRLGEPGTNEELGGLTSRLDRRIDDLRFAALAIRMEPVAHVFDRFPRVVRDTARRLGKSVDFIVEGREIELDRAMLEEMADPLIHLLRNAVDHGLEPPDERRAAGKPERGRLTLRATRSRAGVLIDVTDDGRGIDRDRVLARAAAVGLIESGTAADPSDDVVLRLLTEAGFSTADEVTELSGRGVGMNAVAERVRALGGAVDLESEPGVGTTFSIRLPFTFAQIQALRVRVGSEYYAVPLTHVAEVVELSDREIVQERDREVLRLRGEDVPFVRLRTVLGAPGADSEPAALVTEVGARRTALAVDELVTREQVVIKEFDVATGMLPFFSGATLLPDGRPALVLDPTSVL